MARINQSGLMPAIVSFILLTAIIFLVSYFFVTKPLFIGPIMILLGTVTLIPVFLFRIPLQVIKADTIFGMIDNGILALFALSGAEFFGILGAIVGGLVGNAISDGLAGIFEGYEWQRIKRLKIKADRTVLSVTVGKLSGCLFGAGIVLTIAWSVLGL